MHSKKIIQMKKKLVAKKSQPYVKASIRTKKKYTYICSHEGCAKQVVKGGVCVMHGASKKSCSVEGCTNQAKKGGVCITHGAKFKRCSFKGCTNQVVKGGVCITHGAKTKRCSHQGCTNKVYTGGVCVTHGAKVSARKRCTFEGCSSYAQKAGLCKRHCSESINAIINTAAQAKNTVTPSLPPSQSIDYEDEEELNSWIWRSHACINK